MRRNVIELLNFEGSKSKVLQKNGYDVHLHFEEGISESRSVILSHGDACEVPFWEISECSSDARGGFVGEFFRSN